MKFTHADTLAMARELIDKYPEFIPADVIADYVEEKTGGELDSGEFEQVVEWVTMKLPRARREVSRNISEDVAAINRRETLKQTFGLFREERLHRSAVETARSVMERRKDVLAKLGKS